MLSFKPPFHSPLSLSSRGSLVLHFLPDVGVICISEVIDISAGNLNSSLCFIQPSVSHDVLCIKVKINRMTICSLDGLLSQFGASLVVLCSVLTVIS